MIQIPQTLINIKLKEFDTFSDAFRYAIDKYGYSHVEIYKKIGMDKGQFSNIYNGVVKNPQAPTRNSLLKYVDFDIYALGEKWVLEAEQRAEKKSNDTHRDSIHDLANQINSSAKESGIQYKDRAELIDILQSRANTLSQELREFSLMISMLKNMDDSDT